MYLKHCKRVRIWKGSDTGLTNLQTVAIFALLLVNYAKTEIDFICLFEVWSHAHDLGECLFGVVERAISVIENTYAVPQFRLLHHGMVSLMRAFAIRFNGAYLWILKMVKSLLVRRVGILQVVHH